VNRIGMSQVDEFGIGHGGTDVAMPKILLNKTHVYARFDEVNGVGMTQVMNRNVFQDPGTLTGLFEGNLDAVMRQRALGGGHVGLAAARSGKDESRVAVRVVKWHDQFQGSFRKRHISFFVSLGVANMHEHPIGIDVTDGEMGAFSQSQAQGIDGGQTDPVAFDGHSGQKATYLIAAEHLGKLSFLSGTNECQGCPVPLEGVGVEELDAAQGDGAGGACPVAHIKAIEEVLTQFFLGNKVRWLLVVPDQVSHGSDIALLGAR